MKIEFQGITKHVFLDVKNMLEVLKQLGADTTALTQRFEELRERVPRDERAGSDEWQKLEQAVIDLDDATEPPGEPWALDAIRALRPEKRTDRYAKTLSETEIREKIKGAWYGRVAGCTLGKPVEAFLSEEHSRQNLHKHLQEAGCWPVDDYIATAAVDSYWRYLEANDINPHWLNNPACRAALKENLEYAPEDDDVRYTIVALEKVKRYGRDFDIEDTLMFYNYLLKNKVSDITRDRIILFRMLGMEFPQCVRFMNAMRESLGPQIRSDLYGYINPGHPEEAARMAWNEAAGTGSESGIYGALWIAAAIASAFVETDVEHIIRCGMEQIPATSRLYRELDATIDVCQHLGSDFERIMDDIERRTDHYHCIHAINNCCIIAAALLASDGDFSKSICFATQAGYDTDCNAAHAGSVAGILAGYSGIPSRWIDPLNDSAETIIPGMENVLISNLVRETITLL